MFKLRKRGQQNPKRVKPSDMRTATSNYLRVAVVEILALLVQ